MRDLKIPLLMTVFLVVVLVGVGARSLYYQQRVVAPLSKLGEGAPGVTSLDLVDSSNGTKDVVVTLSGDIKLEEVYTQLEALASDSLGSSFGRLIVRDRRTRPLAEAYYRVHFTVQEGISTGLFAQMAEDVERLLAGAAVTNHRVFVGERYVFVQLHQGEHYLYEVVPRAQGVAAREPSGRGGISLW